MIYLYLILYGVLKAIKDRTDNPFTPSIFPTEGTFWNKGTGKKVFGYYFDCWHICDSLQWVCIGVAVANSWIQFGLFIGEGSLAFNIFYFIFKKSIYAKSN